MFVFLEIARPIEGPEHIVVIAVENEEDTILSNTMSITHDFVIV